MSEDLASQVIETIKSTDPKCQFRPMRLLGDGQELVVEQVCAEDLRRALWPEFQVERAAKLFHGLLSLKGKTIKDVVLDNSKNADVESIDFNPFGNIVNIKVIVE